MEYALIDEREKYRFAAENPAKLRVLEQLLAKHRHDNVLIIGQYLNQLDKIAAHAPGAADYRGHSGGGARTAVRRLP